MIRLFLSGGFGNQLFEYATARAVSIRTGAPLEIDLRFYSKDTFGTPKAAWLVDLPVKASFKRYDNSLLGPHHPLRRAFDKFVLERWREVHVDRGLAFNERVMQLGSNAVLIGYFQCYRYFEQHWASIASDLDMTRFVDTAWVHAQEARAPSWCAVHIRRGDYVGDPRFEMRSPRAYYVPAMDRVRHARPDTRFSVFSDDIPWCRQQAFLQGCDFYEGPQDRHPAVDLATMSRASSNIIGNSSYSWWAAWFGQQPGKLIVAPSLWVDGLQTKDLDVVPDSWSIV